MKINEIFHPQKSFFCRRIFYLFTVEHLKEGQPYDGVLFPQPEFCDIVAERFDDKRCHFLEDGESVELAEGVQVGVFERVFLKTRRRKECGTF